MKHTRLLAAVALCALAMPACAASTRSSEQFVRNAAIGGDFEIKSSRIALEKSHNSAVREFAQQMIAAHTKANEQLKATLPNSGVEPSVANVQMDPKHQKQLDMLESATAAHFDHLYISEQKMAHKEAVNLFRAYAGRGDDAALKEFAKQTLPTLREHQKHVMELKG